MDTYRRVASVVAASSQKDVEDAEMQPTDESVPLRYVRASMRHAASLVIAAYCVVTQPVTVPCHCCSCGWLVRDRQLSMQGLAQQC